MKIKFRIARKPRFNEVFNILSVQDEKIAALVRRMGGIGVNTFDVDPRPGTIDYLVIPDCESCTSPCLAKFNDTPIKAAKIMKGCAADGLCADKKVCGINEFVKTLLGKSRGDTA